MLESIGLEQTKANQLNCSFSSLVKLPMGEKFGPFDAIRMIYMYGKTLSSPPPTDWTSQQVSRSLISPQTRLHSRAQNSKKNPLTSRVEFAIATFDFNFGLAKKSLIRAPKVDRIQYFASSGFNFDSLSAEASFDNNSLSSFSFLLSKLKFHILLRSTIASHHRQDAANNWHIETHIVSLGWIDGCFCESIYLSNCIKLHDLS